MHLEIVAVVGLASLFVFYLLAHATIFDQPLKWPREHWGPLIGCGFCSSFWIVGLLLWVTGTYDPVTHLAAAGLAGILSSHL